jgi:phosphopantothenoylcysteine decarboxylase/phosphopantothenate--cysteine ligase
LACGAVGKGKMPEPELLIQYILQCIAYDHDLTGKKVLVTAGPTQEALDPVRYLTNHSTGKMGYAIAKMAMLRGADVTLVTGPTALTPPPFVTVIPVCSAQEMFDAVTASSNKSDIIIKAAAVADYTPEHCADHKLKKSDTELSVTLKRTQDILKYLGSNRNDHQVICGFSMETENLIENSKKKLTSKNIDMICANSLMQSGAGFGVDTNIITIITADNTLQLPLLSKEEAANLILTHANAILK